MQVLFDKKSIWLPLGLSGPGKGGGGGKGGETESLECRVGLYL